MDQTQILILVLKVVCLSGWCSLAVWVGYYSRHARWWKDRLGKSFVYHAIAVGGLLMVSTLSLFLHFNRTTSYVAAWVDAGLIGLVTPVMLLRTWEFRKIVKAGPLPPPHCETCTCVLHVVAKDED